MKIEEDNMEKKKRFKVVLIVVIIAVIIWFTSVFLYMCIPEGSENYTPPNIILKKTYESEKKITMRVDFVWKDGEAYERAYGEKYYRYEIYNTTYANGTYEFDIYTEGSLESIRNVSSKYVLWNDNDGNHLISEGDEFIIYLNEELTDRNYKFRLKHEGAQVVKIEI